MVTAWENGEPEVGTERRLDEEIERKRQFAAYGVLKMSGN